MSASSVLRGLSNQVDSKSKCSTPLRILILGGTGFIGPCYVQAALNRGHKVSVFNRGQRQTTLPADVECLVGDRNGELDSIKRHEWDAAIDLAAFVPAWVRSLGEALKDRVNHYTFISTAATYEVPVGGQNIDESSRVRGYEGSSDPYQLVRPRNLHEYGALKVLCEREAERQFPGNTLVVRPGHIVGPREPGGYLTYWAVRVAKGGEILVAGDPWMPIQFIDARDLAEWSIRMIESRTTGIYNAAGPADTTSLGKVINAARATLQPSSRPVWVPSSWLLVQQGSEMWDSPLFWSYDSGWEWCLRGISSERALANGLTFRPVNVTLADAFACYQKEAVERQSELAVLKRNESGVVERGSIPWVAYLQREKEVLTAWRTEQEQHSAGQISKLSVDSDGMVHVPAYQLPLSIYMSDAAKRVYIDERLSSPTLEMSSDIAKMREILDCVFYRPKLEKAKSAYPVVVEEKTIGGVHTYEIAPKEGIAKQNERRVLINLHSGDFRVGAGVLQLIESIPFAASAKIKVISIDYRQGPEYKFPAASEDVAAVYQELLKRYEPQNIGIYGNSTGGTLAAMAVAWLRQAGQPRPGAIALISAVHAALGGGDSYFTAPPLFPQFGFKFPSPPPCPNGRPLAVPYLAEADLNAPLISPFMFPEVLADFPHVLLIAGTRDFACSQMLHAHRQLINAGIDTELHVLEGMWHHFIHDADLRESKEAYEATARFFNSHLGKSH